MAFVELRCGECGLLLGEIDGGAKIICRKCHGMNELDKETGEVTYKPQKRKRMKDRSTSSGVRFY